MALKVKHSLKNLFGELFRFPEKKCILINYFSIFSQSIINIVVYQGRKKSKFIT